MLRRSILWSGSAFAATLAGSYALAQSSEIKELNFGIISTESQANQRPLFEPFVTALSTRIGIPVKSFYSTQYAGIIEAMRFKKVDFAWFGGASYIQAVRMANAEAFAQTVGLNGEMGYTANLIMNVDNPRTRDAKAMGGDKYVLQNGRDLTFAFNDPNSTSGFLVPAFYIFARNNVDPRRLFRRVLFSGSHEATALAVANNQVDVATNNNESLARLRETNADAARRIEVVWTSVTIPSDPIAYRKDLPEDVKKRIRDAFLGFDDRTILGPLRWSRFIPANDARWNYARELEIGKQILETQSNDSLSPADREKKLAELRKQLEAFKTN